MANLMLVYGMRLLPSDEIDEVGEAIVKLKNGREARVTMHVLEAATSRLRRSFGRVSTPFSASIRRFSILVRLTIVETLRADFA